MDIQYISKWLQTSEVNDENRHDSSLNIQTNFASILNKSAMFVPTNRDKNYFYCTTIPAGDRCSKIVTVYQYLSCLPVPYFDVCVCNSVCVMFLFYEWAVCDDDDDDATTNCTNNGKEDQ